LCVGESRRTFAFSTHSSFTSTSTTSTTTGSAAAGSRIDSTTGSGAAQQPQQSPSLLFFQPFLRFEFWVLSSCGIAIFSDVPRCAMVAFCVEFSYLKNALHFCFC
jgi:hypothetical protein